MNRPLNDALGASQATRSSDRSGAPGTRLHGRRLILARVVWVAVVTLIVVPFLAWLPAYWTAIQTVCTSATWCVFGQLTPASAQALQKLGLSVSTYAAFTLALTIALAFLGFSLGAVIFWRRSDDWMALLVALVVVASVTLNGAVYHLEMNSAWRVLVMVLDLLGDSVIVLVLALFPDGRFVPRWTRWLLLCWAVAAVLSFIYPINYVLVWYAAEVLLVIAQVYRYRTALSPLQRQQYKWLLFGACVGVIFIVWLVVSEYLFPSLIQDGSFYPLFILPAFLVISFIPPLCFGFAILRYRLWDIDIIIHRTLVYGTLTACVIALYVLVVVGLGALLQSSGNLLISLLATGLVAVLFQPLRERLQRAVNRLMYGERDTPYRVISRLGQRLEATMAPDAVLPTIVETVAQALKLPYAAITLKQEGEMVTAAAYGVPKEHLIHLPLVYHNEQLGEIVLAPRGPGESFTPADLALLEDLARQTGDAVHTVRLTTDLQYLTEELQASRTQLVTTREEERRRLRRDLHDGLGSALTSMSFQLDAASNVLERDPQAARTLLADLKHQTQAAIADIRRLVYNLRPPILDEWGLVAALREQVAQYQLDHVRVCVEAPESLPPLPAAVEVAAYRIALEALANVVRHAHASNCTMRLALSDEVLTVEVRDDGEGLPQGYHAGVGISAMRERAAELGGSCSVETITGGGARISAWLPLQKEGGSVDVG